jgi:hypothetical protein
MSTADRAHWLLTQVNTPNVQLLLQVMAFNIKHNAWVSTMFARYCIYKDLTKICYIHIRQGKRNKMIQFSASVTQYKQH